MAEISEATLRHARTGEFLTASLGWPCSTFLFLLLVFDTCGSTIVVVVLNEACSLISREAGAPCSTVVQDLFRCGLLAIWHAKGRHFTTRVDDIFLAMWLPPDAVGELCSITRVVAVLVWDLDLAKAVRAPIHGHHALDGTGEWELLVGIPHWSLFCDRVCFFGPQMAVWLPLGYCNEWAQRRAIIGLLHLAIEPAALLLLNCEGFWSQCDSELGSSEHCRIILQSARGPQHGFTRLLAPPAQLVLAMLCSSGREKLLQLRRTCSRHRDDLFVTMREAAALRLQRFQPGSREFRYANLAVACEVVLSSRLRISMAILCHANESLHAKQLRVHKFVH